MRVGGSPGACPDCLRRSRLIARLAPFIERSCDDRPGRRIPELLGLDDDALVRAVAPRRVDEVLSGIHGIEEAELEQSLIRSDCWAVCRHDPGWPPGLLQQADAPRCLIGKGDPGQILGLAVDEAATIVGARKATEYGVQVARRLGSEVALSGVAVVSGMALGIDGAVHRGSLGRGRSIAVLGGSVDRPYPASNRNLYVELIENGAVVSEMPPGTGPRRWCFPARNRIMASLSGATVLVEAARRSGSLITAELALAAGREVGAVPGPVTSTVSAGCLDLIASGGVLVRDGFDVLEVLAPGVPRSSNQVPAPRAGLEGEVLEAIANGASSAESVATATGTAIGKVMIAITGLEFDGLIEVDVSGRLLPVVPPRDPGPEAALAATDYSACSERKER